MICGGGVVTVDVRCPRRGHTSPQSSARQPGSGDSAVNTRQAAKKDVVGRETVAVPRISCLVRRVGWPEFGWPELGWPELGWLEVGLAGGWAGRRLGWPEVGLAGGWAGLEVGPGREAGVGVGRPWPGSGSGSGGSGRGRAVLGEAAVRVTVPVAFSSQYNDEPIAPRPRPALIGPRARRRRPPSPRAATWPRVRTGQCGASSPGTATATPLAPSAHHQGHGPAAQTTGSVGRIIRYAPTRPKHVSGSLALQDIGVRPGHAGCRRSRLRPDRQHARSTAEAALTRGIAVQNCESRGRRYGGYCGLCDGADSKICRFGAGRCPGAVDLGVVAAVVVDIAGFCGGHDSKIVRRVARMP